MKRWLVIILRMTILFIVIAALVLIFPKGLEFIEIAARDLRYFWWVIFLIVLAVWLIWGLGRKKEK